MVNLPNMPIDDPPLLKINQFRGLNASVTPSQLDYNESPDMVNMFLDERGALRKRYGYERVFPVPISGSPRINGMFVYVHMDQTSEAIFSAGTNLYRLNAKGTTPTVIYSGLANAPTNFFTMNGLCYILDSANYLVYNGTTVSPVVPYVPTIMISTTPVGVGTPNEDFNLLGSGFRQTFSGDNNALIYQLALTNLDATAPIVIVNGVTKTLGTDYSINYVTGQVTFVTNQKPSTGTNNVDITAYKTFANYPNRIKNCTMAVSFGGTNDTRVFLSGNINYPHQVWRSGLYQPNYFPENGFYQIGTQDSSVTGFAKQYSTLVVFKDKSIFCVKYEIDPVTGDATFPIMPINDQTGAFAMRSIAVVQNEPTFLDRSGVYSLNQTYVRDERNVKNVSNKIENRLLFEQNLQNAVCVDYDNKYYCALNGDVYVWDYIIDEWYVYTNILVDSFLEYKGSLYFGSNGLIYRIKDSLQDALPYNDDGNPITCYWRSKIISFNSDEELKLVRKIFYSIMPSTDTSCELWYTTNKKNRRFYSKSIFKSFGYSTWNYATFSYGAVLFPQETVAKIKAKKIIYIQIELRNDQLNETLHVLSVGLQYLTQRYVK
jgi:hypothetical protein